MNQYDDNPGKFGTQKTTPSQAERVSVARDHLASILEERSSGSLVDGVPSAMLASRVFRRLVPSVIQSAKALLGRLAVLLLKVLRTNPTVVRFLVRIVQASPLLQKIADRTVAAARRPHSSKAESQSELVALMARRLRVAANITAPREREGKPRLAFVTPLPPDRTGVADHSVNLIPALSKDFEVVAVVPGAAKRHAEVACASTIISCSDLRKHAGDFDFVLYNLGNSPFHTEIMEVAVDVPGIVLFHDVFISGLLHALEYYPAWTSNTDHVLLEEGGSLSLKKRYAPGGLGEALAEYTGAFAISRRSQGVIVTNEYAERLLTGRWGQCNIGIDIVPLCHAQRELPSRSAARERLGIPSKTFLICSFGHLNHEKRAQELVAAVQNLQAQSAAGCLLHFVGGGDVKILGNMGSNVHITGYAPDSTYSDYLAAADVAVQLRAITRGESSAALLDVMGAGLPVIVDNIGAFADLPEGIAIKLQQPFQPEDLVSALEQVVSAPIKARDIGLSGKSFVEKNHAPEMVAENLKKALARCTAEKRLECDFARLRSLVTDVPRSLIHDSDLEDIARLIVGDRALPMIERQLLVDVTNIAISDSRTGIQRVVRAILSEMFLNPPVGYRIEPVQIVLNGAKSEMIYARKFTADFLGYPGSRVHNEAIALGPDDIFLMLDLNVLLASMECSAMLDRMQSFGVEMHGLVYDTLPLDFPAFFPDGAKANHYRWLEMLGQRADSLICISQAVARSTQRWLDKMGCERSIPIRAVHLGADLDASAPTSGVPGDAPEVFAALDVRPTFLMVGTIEPRKGHLQVLEAVSQLWSQGVDLNLVIVGTKGWNDERTEIRQVLQRLRKDKARGVRLFWLRGISDEFLGEIYTRSSCLVAASVDEGFGLPLIEAAQHGLPVLARDIPVFREVAGRHAAYFRASNSGELAEAMHHWLDTYRADTHPRSENMPWRTWHQCADDMMAALTVSGSVAQIPHS